MTNYFKEYIDSPSLLAYNKNKVELIVSIFAKVREQPFVLFLILKSNNCFYSVIYVLWSSFV